VKKSVLGLLVAAPLMIGATGLTAAPAHADPYTGTVVAAPAAPKTKSTAGKKAKVTLTAAGNVVPTGSYKTTCKKGKAKVKASGEAKNGKVKTGKLSKGKWTCKVKFDGTGVFADSKFSTTVKAK
jgi:hypothetical protein